MHTLATNFKHMARGMEGYGLSPVRFYALEESARRGEIDADDLCRLVKEDYENGEDWEAAMKVLFEALLEDAKLST